MSEHKFTYLNHRGRKALRTVTPLALEYLMEPGYGYSPGYFLRALDHEKNAQRSFAVDPTRMFPEAGFLRIEIGDLVGIKDTVKNLEHHAIEYSRVGSAETIKATPVNVSEARRAAVADFAMWLTTRSEVLKVGATEEVPNMIAAMDEYFKIKGMNNGRTTVAERVGDQDNTQDR